MKTLPFIKVFVLAKGGFRDILTKFSLFVLFLDKKTSKKRRCTLRKKSVNICINWLSWYRGFFLIFCSKSHLLFFFSTKNSYNKTMCQAKKTLHFVKIVALVMGGFCWNLYTKFGFCWGDFAPDPRSPEGIWKSPRARRRARGDFQIPDGRGDLGQNPRNKIRILYIFFWDKNPACKKNEISNSQLLSRPPKSPRGSRGFERLW